MIKLRRSHLFPAPESADDTDTITALDGEIRITQQADFDEAELMLLQGFRDATFPLDSWVR